MSISREKVKIISQEQIASGIYSMWFASRAIAQEAAAGQFVSVYSADGAHLLPRPISICQVDREKAPSVWYTGWQDTARQSLLPWQQETS